MIVKQLLKGCKSIRCRVLQLAALPLVQSPEDVLVGGQAVLEGVMMRSPHSYAVAVRRPNGLIAIGQDYLDRPSERHPWLRYPILRGLGTLGQAMVLGVRALKYSAEFALEDPEAPELRPEKKKPEMNRWMLAVNILLSLAFFIALYKLLPLYMATKLQSRYHVVGNLVVFNFVDGIIRIAFFLGFLALLAQSKEIKRVFEYHGAEHRVVFNFESGKPVNVENAQSFVTWHPRCGTSFLLVVMILSTLVYMAIPVHSFGAKLAIRVLSLPLIVGLSYELIRFAAKRRNSLLALLTAPGLWLQRITTQPPSDEQTAVAIRALNGAMELEKAQGGELVIA